MKGAHRKRCLVCRAGSEELCRALGAAAAVDALLDHRRTCRGACRTREGEGPVLCARGARLRDDMRRAGCLAGRTADSDLRRRRLLDQAQEDVGYPDEYFHVSADGSTERCVASAIRLRGPAPTAPLTG